jgi:4-hydroxy-4-methyl-2-oxoglutarate aldolase
VIDGGVRDTEALEARGFPVFARAVVLRGASKKEPGSAGSRARVGDVEVQRGDWIVGDADGVALVPAAALQDVLTAGRARAAREQELFKALAAGRTTLELLGLDASKIEVE